jgi:septal ring factor EnvC (AmiA/AmiB activator)
MKLPQTCQSRGNPMSANDATSETLPHCQQRLTRLEVKLAQSRQENDRLQTELAELQQRFTRLSESEENLRILFELSDAGFYLGEVDPPCPIDLPKNQQADWFYQHIRVVKANPAFAAMALTILMR